MRKHVAVSVFCKLLFTLLLLSGSVQAQVERYLEGVHYTRIADSAYLRSLEPAAGRADVLEVFWYGCPSCNAFDPLLDQWVQAHGDAIAFSRSPMIWNAATAHHARVFFAAQQLGIYEEAHRDIFAAIHQQHNSLLEEAAVAALFAEHGVQAEAFASTWHSFAVDTGMRKAEALQREMRVPGVPALVVNGRWLVNVDESISSHAAMLDVAEFLLDKEKAAAL